MNHGARIFATTAIFLTATLAAFPSPLVDCSHSSPAVITRTDIRPLPYKQFPE